MGTAQKEELVLSQLELIFFSFLDRQKIYIREVLTHAEYDKNKWKE